MLLIQILQSTFTKLNTFTVSKSLTILDENDKMFNVKEGIDVTAVYEEQRAHNIICVQ